MLAEILASFGRQHWIRELPGPESGAARARQRIAVTRGRKQDFCVGDRVQIDPIGEDQAVINAILPRRNLLLRSDQYRRKQIAANIDQIGLVLAAEPPFSEALAVRVGLAAAIASIPVTWLINKSDRIEALALIEPRLRLYQSLSMPMIRLSARHDANEDLLEGELAGWLQGKTSPSSGRAPCNRANTPLAFQNASICPRRALRRVAASSIHPVFSSLGSPTALVLKSSTVCRNGPND
ncbi:MAG: GTPase RsgA [Betaproteobacteria bacterium]|nr:GTPase RsgA [Betaproteobacteria bacterium]